MGRSSRLAAGFTVAAAAAAGVYAVAQADSEVVRPAATPIEHVVVIFGENESFDHYFGTYPTATNPPGQPQFTAKPGTPAVNGLQGLLVGNPNADDPARIDRSNPVTCDHNHNYGAEQKAFNGGLMDKFVENTGGGSCTDKTIVMDYYDGNTVTALWNIAQGFAMSDRHFGSTFGPSTIGALNIVSGNTHGVQQVGLGENGTMIFNSQPALDDCSNGKGAGLATMSGRNIGDLMNDAGVTWGWFAGGFRPTSWEANGDAVCSGSQKNAIGAVVGDYFPHHAPFQYFPSTANRHHIPPSSVDAIGTTDAANHQYDLKDFDAALAAGKLPQVSFLKAVSAEDSHPGYSGPLDEQHFLARVLNEIQLSKYWDTTAVFIAYDDSDGWYDHVFLPPQKGSRSTSDALDGVGRCGPAPAAGDYHGRCGPGPRLPLLVVSPWAKQNFVDSTQTEQASITRFIEDNWNLGRIGDQSFDDRAQPLTNVFDFDPAHARAPRLYLDAETGQPLLGAPAHVAIAPPRPDPGPRPGPSPTPTPTVAATATATGTPAPTATPKPAPPPTPKVAVKLNCKTSGGGKRITVTCTASGKDAARKTTLRLAIAKGRKTVASAKASLKKKKAKVIVRPRNRLKPGRYTLKITVSQSGRANLAVSRTVRLK
jgi:phospholipase C